MQLGAAFADVNDRFLIVCSNTKADVMARDGKRVDVRNPPRVTLIHNPINTEYLHVQTESRYSDCSISRAATFAFN